MSGMSPESQMLLKLLDDGQWHLRREIHEKLKAAVAPGKALRRYEQAEKGRVAQYGPRKGPALTEDEQIDSGRSSIATDTINSMKKRWIEVADTEQGRMLRRRPQPLPIADHRTPPPPMPGSPDPLPDSPEQPTSADGPPVQPAPLAAFFSEAQIRLIVTEVVEHVIATQLDRFQRGMRGFLLGRFADLEQHLTSEQRRQPAVPRRYR